MLSTERGAFAKLVETLCAGFNVPATDARIDSYWRGCHTMQLLAFERTVDYLLGPESNVDEDLPTPRAMHTMHKRMLSARRASAQPPPAGPAPERDIFEVYCNRLLLQYLWQKARRSRSGASDASLAALIAVKNNFVIAYRDMCGAEPEASLDLRDALIDAWEPLYVPYRVLPTPVEYSDPAWMRLGRVYRV